MRGRAFAATLVPPPRGQAEVEAVAPERIHGVVLEQPIERVAVAELEADHDVRPHGRAGGGRAAAVPAGRAPRRPAAPRAPPPRPVPPPPPRPPRPARPAPPRGRRRGAPAPAPP